MRIFGLGNPSTFEVTLGASALALTLLLGGCSNRSASGDSGIGGAVSETGDTIETAVLSVRPDQETAAAFRTKPSWKTERPAAAEPILPLMGHGPLGQPPPPMTLIAGGPQLEPAAGGRP